MTDSPQAYPSSWHPRWAPPLELEPEPDSALKPLEMELHCAAMDDAEWAEFVKRARGSRG
jgi:hypothetical protein